MGSPVIRFDIGSPNPDGQRAFYGGLFGWTFAPLGPFNWGPVSTNHPDGIDGGLSLGESGRVTLAVRVDDLEAPLAQVESLGGKVLYPPFAFNDDFRLAVCEDPDGNMLQIVSGDGAGTKVAPWEDQSGA